MKDAEQTWMSFLPVFYGKNRRIFRSMTAQKQRSQTGRVEKTLVGEAIPQKHPKVTRSN